MPYLAYIPESDEFDAVEDENEDTDAGPRSAVA